MRLVLADDHNLFREALCYYLRQCADDIAIIEAGDLDGALAAGRREKADLVLLDFIMPGMNGARGIQRARQELPGIPIVILSGNISPEETAEALRCGATSVISKELSSDALRDVLRRILAGEQVVAASGLDQSSVVMRDRTDTAPFRLTPRELDAVRLLIRGMADKAIAHELGIAAVTVRLHLYNAFRKMGARNRLDAVRIALQAGIGS